MMRLSAAWRKTWVSRANRHPLALDEVAQQAPRADRWQLVVVPHEDEPAAERQGAQQGGKDADIDHRDLVEDDRVAVERLPFVALEDGAALPVEAGLEQPVDGLRLVAGQFGDPLGGAAGGGGNQHLQPLVLHQPDDPPQGGRLAGARAAG